MAESIAIIGGTGNVGFGLALRWARAGERVVIGSRDLSRADAAAARVRAAVDGSQVEGLSNPDAVGESEIVLLTVPLVAQIDTLKAIRDRLKPGTVLVDTTVALERALGGRLSHIIPLWAGSSAQQAARYAGENVRVTSAFHGLSATSLADHPRPVDSDVLITGDDPEARSVVAHWVGKIPGARPVDLGPLENSRYAEHLAALLISLNLRHKVKSSGVRFTGLPGPGEAR